MTPLIRLQNLTKHYGQFLALDAVNLEVGPGVTGLLGPNGAGKSTLIKVLLGLVRVSEGSGTVLGHDIRAEARQIRSKVGFMPEDDCYMYGQSGIESVQVAGRLSRLPKTESLRRGHEILDFCGMGKERYQNVETYSTGMRQKLRFAMSIIHDPELLILDEPTSGLDPEERESMLNRIRILSDKFGKAVILCTHILPDVKVVCDSVAILAAGKIRLSQPLEQLLQSPNPSVTVRVTENVDGFSQALRQTSLQSDQNGEWFQIAGHTQSVGATVWSIAEESGAAISTVQPSQSSLEDVFLKVVRESQNANS